MPFMADVPPALEERVMCSIIAAVKYELPANIVLAVAGQENGKPGQWVKNKNGTHDVGPMQFNTGYLADLAKYGITAQDVAKPGCYPFELAAWRIRGHVLNDHGDLWTRVANYHSRTPKYNAIYRKLVMSRAVKWADWLDARFKTYEVNQKTVTVRQKAVSQTAQIESKSGFTPKGNAVDSYKPQHPSRLENFVHTDYVPRKLIQSN